MRTTQFKLSPDWINVYVEVNRRTEALLSKQFSLTFTQYRVLLELSIADKPLRNIDFANALVLKPSSITCALGQLETEGFITKTQLAADRRAATITLTPAGGEQVEKANIGLSLLLQELWEPLSPVEIEAIVESTRLVAEQLRLASLTKVDAPVQPFYTTAIATVNRLISTELKELFNLSFSEFRILFELLSTDKVLNGKELADLLFLAPSVISQVAQKLCKRELITQAVDQSDRRNATFLLTEKGANLVDEAASLLADKNAHIYDKMSNKNLIVLSKAAFTMNKHLNDRR